MLLFSVIQQILLLTREGEGAPILREVGKDHVALYEGLCSIDHVMKLDASDYYQEEDNDHSHYGAFVSLVDLVVVVRENYLIPKNVTQLGIPPQCLPF